MQSFQRVILICILSVSLYHLHGQPALKDSVEAYNYWVKRGMIEMTYAFMNDYIATVTDTSLPKSIRMNCNNEITGLEKFEKTFINQIDKKRSDVLESDFNNISQFLVNNNWRVTKKNLLNPLLENYKSSKSLNMSFFSITKPNSIDSSTDIQNYNNKKKYWNATLNRLIKDFNESIKKINSERSRQNEKIDASLAGNEINVPVNKGTTTRKIRNPLAHIRLTPVFTLLIIIMSFFVGGFLVYQYSKKAIYKILDDDLDKYLDGIPLNESMALFKYIGVVKLLKARKDIHKKEKEYFIKEAERYKNKTSNIPTNKTPIKNDELPSEKDSYFDDSAPDPARVKVWDITDETKTKSAQYFSIPESDGRFIVEKGEPNNDGRKYYKVESDKNSAQGILYYISSDQDKRAINRLDSYLKPVCEIENITNAEVASNITLIRPGVVIQIGDSWVINPDHKVKIKLI